ncbi:hypothetical protein VTL71DRAFT_4948 [Oculimacula yallundae]|uniref:Uncharacterized protein n=1 Tax=Oculimacula yallundae TaxID=86028 RepID=A0ABR4C3G7_9HELO
MEEESEDQDSRCSQVRGRVLTMVNGHPIALKLRDCHGMISWTDLSIIDSYPSQAEVLLPADSYANQELYSIPEYGGSGCDIDVHEEAKKVSEKRKQKVLPQEAQESQETIARQRSECGICKGLRGPDKKLYNYKGHWARECTRNVGVTGTIFGCPWCNTRNHTPSSPQCTANRSLRGVWLWLIVARDGKPLFTCSWDMFRMLAFYFSDPAEIARPQTARFAQQHTNEDQPIESRVRDPFWDAFEGQSVDSTVTWDMISGWNGSKDMELPELDVAIGKKVRQLPNGGRFKEPAATVDIKAQATITAPARTPAQVPARSKSQAPQDRHHAGGTQPFKQEGSQSRNSKRSRSEYDQQHQGPDKRQEFGQQQQGFYQRETSEEREFRQLQLKIQQGENALEAQQRREHLALLELQKRLLDSQAERLKHQIEIDEARERADRIRNRHLSQFNENYGSGVGNQGYNDQRQYSSYPSSSSSNGQSYQQSNRGGGSYQNRQQEVARVGLRGDLPEATLRPEAPGNRGGYQDENRGGHRGSHRDGYRGYQPRGRGEGGDWGRGRGRGRGYRGHD